MLSVSSPITGDDDKGFMRVDCKVDVVTGSLDEEDRDRRSGST